MSAKKRVIFCTYSSIYSAKILEQLIADNEIECVAIINSTRVLNPAYGHLRGALKQLKTTGLRYSTYLFLITDFFRLLQPLFFLKKWPLRDIHALANQYQISLLDTRDINNPQTIDFIKKLMPDYLLGAHFNQLLKAPVLEMSGIECINIHPSLLPAYKGVDPVFFAMRNNEKLIGVSLHRMAETFDSGEILMQASIAVDPSKSLFFNNCQLFEEGIGLALNWMKNNHQTETVLDNKVKLIDSYDSWPTVADVRKFKKSGNRLIRLSGLWKQQ